jgi:hypothetical protein
MPRRSFFVSFSISDVSVFCGGDFSRNEFLIVWTGFGCCFAARCILAGRAQERAVIVVAGNQWWRVMAGSVTIWF